MKTCFHCEGTGERYAGYAADKLRIIKCQWCNGTGTDPVAVAARDMLAALKMLKGIDDAYGLDLNEPQRDQLHDAIRKAEAAAPPPIADGR